MTIVEHPTYMGHIRKLFRPGDIRCMRDEVGLELGTYLGVKLNAQRIFNVIKEGRMPPDRPWPKEQLETFGNWIDDGCPRGVAKPVPRPDPTAPRIRKDVRSIEEGSEEHERLARAFREMKKKLVHDPDGYFYIAGIHWLPGPDQACRHHENAYNPWHRAYLLVFEDAMRKIPGCEDVTLPYWDITAPTPSWLGKEPFDTYTLPVTMESLRGERYEAGQSMIAPPLEEVPHRAASADIPDTIKKALGHSHWERFNGWVVGRRTQSGIIRAHDNGHGACLGPRRAFKFTISNQDVASFHPLFWFFHCNWDRLWWEWQRQYEADTLEGFRTTLEAGAEWIDDETQNRLDPFGLGVDEMIDLTSHGIDYAHSEGSLSPTEEVAPFEPAALVAGHVKTQNGSFGVSDIEHASVRVKGINRLNIPGSFEIRLLADDTLLATEFFFQSTDATSCSTCKKKGAINFDFIVPLASLARRAMSVEVHAFVEDELAPIPMSSLGEPSINVRLLLEPV